MPPVGARTPILKPWRLKRGFYFLKCRRYQSSSGIFYDYCLMGPDGKRRKLQLRGPRKALSYNFPKRAGGAERLDVHRVFAFNDKRCNGRGLPWSQSRHVHHHPKPRRRPWSNCCAANLVVLSARDHKRWHQQHPDVPRC